MIIMNEYTGEVHESVDECLAAEKEFLKKIEEEKRAKEAHEKELNAAYKEAVEACEKYFKLVGIEVGQDDEGYSVTFHKCSDSCVDDNLFEDIINVLFE